MTSNLHQYTNHNCHHIYMAKKIEKAVLIRLLLVEYGLCNP